MFDASEADALVASIRGRHKVRLLRGMGAMGKLDADLVIIDGASDTFDANESERRFVRGASPCCEAWRKRGGAVLLLAHLPKETKAGMNYSGSTGWHNSVRAAEHDPRRQRLRHRLPGKIESWTLRRRQGVL